MKWYDFLVIRMACWKADGSSFSEIDISLSNRVFGGCNKGITTPAVTQSGLLTFLIVSTIQKEIS